MASELTLSGSLLYSDSEGTEDSLSISELMASVATKRLVHAKQSIPTSEIAIELGDLSSIRWAIFINRDSANYLELKVATGGAIFAKLMPGFFALLPLGSGAQVPYAVATGSSCQLEIIICAL